MSTCLSLYRQQSRIHRMEGLFDETDDDAAEIRLAWRKLVDETLPEVAIGHDDWPVYRNHCFARILLDNAVGLAWRDAIKPPAWRNTPLPVLQTAIDLGEAVLAGEADLYQLNDRSLLMRGHQPRGRQPAQRRRFKNLRRNRLSGQRL